MVSCGFWVPNKTRNQQICKATMHAFGAEENGISCHLLEETHFNSGDMISHMCGYKGLSDSTPIGLSE